MEVLKICLELQLLIKYDQINHYIAKNSIFDGHPRELTSNDYNVFDYKSRNVDDAYTETGIDSL